MTFRAALLLAPFLMFGGPARAVVYADPVGDFVPGYLGPPTPGLDVTSISLDYLNGNFTLTGTMAGPIDRGSSALYVWGIDRGAGTVGFPTIASHVTFDSVLVLTAATSSGKFNDLIDGTKSQSLPAGDVTISGDTITAILPGSFLVPHGRTPNEFGFNLWPRSGTGAITVISDFAPDNSDVAAVGEPMSLALLGVGLAGVTALRRRRR